MGARERKATYALVVVVAKGGGHLAVVLLGIELAFQIVLRESQICAIHA
jgi:hypothetical protein